MLPILMLPMPGTPVSYAVIFDARLRGGVAIPICRVRRPDGGRSHNIAIYAPFFVGFTEVVSDHWRRTLSRLPPTFCSPSRAVRHQAWAAVAGLGAICKPVIQIERIHQYSILRRAISRDGVLRAIKYQAPWADRKKRQYGVAVINAFKASSQQLRPLRRNATE
jgi:hypothetical protein